MYVYAKMISVNTMAFEKDYGSGGGGADKKGYDGNDGGCGDKKWYEKKRKKKLPIYLT